MLSLQHLPIETIDHIFSQLCLHCNSYFPTFSNDDQKENTNALRSLTGTSRLCRCLALPILFHSMGLCTKGRYMLNMVNTYQHLEQCTKNLSLPFIQSIKPDYHHLQDSVKRLGNIGPIITSVQGDHPESVELILTLALCSGVERLQININDLYRITSESTLHLFKDILRLEKVMDLQCLKYLEFITGPEYVPGIAESGITQLLQLSPRLETLVLRGKGLHPPIVAPGLGIFDLGRCRPVLENLTDIHMVNWPLTQSRIYGLFSDTPVLWRILTDTRRLMTFVYVSYDVSYDVHNYPLFTREFTPRNFVKLLLPVQSSLRNLSLDFGPRLLHQGHLSMDYIAIDPHELKRLAHLEYLRLDQFSYCRHQLDRETERATYLADMLPITVRKLRVAFPRYRGGYQCQDCISYLGRRVLAGDFPALECVQIDAPVFQSRVSNWSVLNWIPYSIRSWIVQDPAKELEAAAREAVEQERKLRDAFAGSGVEIRWHNKPEVSISGRLLGT